MHDQREIVERRIRRTIDERIRPTIHTVGPALDVEVWVAPGEPVTPTAARSAVYEPFEIGGVWGEPWGTTWFRCSGEYPAGWPAAGQSVEVLIDLGFGRGPGFQAEGLLYAIDEGGPIRGVHPLHQAVPAAMVGDGHRVGFLLEAASNPVVALSHAPTPFGDPATAPPGPLYRLRRCHLALRNDDVWHLDLDLQVVVGLMHELALDDPRRSELLVAIEHALDALDLHDVPGTAGTGRERLRPILETPAAASAHQTTLVGHAHIDTAWLWPLRETRRKCARTFSSAVTLMEGEYPEHRFACSQAAQYQWIEDDHPELFERIRGQVAAGRFIPVGSMWVEADCNLPSGESLARQFVWGRRYFADRFGLESTTSNAVVWIPDVFGYAGNLPQIMRLAGCEFFLTQKLSWNQTNPFPHHSFWWEGIDGSRVFTHFPPVDTYNGEVTSHELRRAQRNFRDRGRATRTLYPFGHGDGGGGPTREMLERARRVADVEGLPRATIGTPVEFFRDAVDEYGSAAAVWRGELYFEMHRGTYTSQARTKWGNRRCELALRELELWSVLAERPPLAELEGWWKEVLLHQFHDIIPGSSIAWVHDDTEAAHARVLSAVDDAIRRTLTDAIAGDELVAANAGPFDVEGVVDTGDGWGWASAPALGAGVVGPRPDHVAPVRATDRVLDNGIVRVTVADDGRLASVIDLRLDREVLAGPGNELQLFADHPNAWDAWDIEPFTIAAEPRVITQVDSIDIAEHDGLRASIVVVRTFGDSSIVQEYVLAAGSARLDIVTTVDWHEDERLLKAAFPLDVRADDAAYDTQYGHVRRPTHRNTSWDWARFEVCGHQWADVSEPDFGVAVLNDGKYGHDCLGGPRSTTMRLSLLRAPNYPDPDADRGRHTFTYSLLPHGPGLAEVLPAAWALNLPPRVVTGSPREPIVRIDHPGVVVTAAKPADDGSGDLVVRYHEALGARARFTVSTPTHGGVPVPCDLLEIPIEGSPGRERHLRPFQVETLRIPRT